MSTAEPAPKPGLPFFFLIGLLLIIAGPIINAIQMFVLHQFVTPWYMPILATVGVLMMAASIWRRGGILRILGTGFFMLLAGLEWFFLAVFTLTPAYEGPAQVNATIPSFSAKLANDKTFSSTELANKKATILLFFRGHW